MTERLKKSVVCIRDSRQEIVGCGYLVAAREVLTCSHVADMAGAAARLHFPFSDQKQDSYSVEKVVARLPEGPFQGYPKDWLVPAEQWQDWAVLRLDRDPPPDIVIAPLKSPKRPWGHRFAAYGFPPRANEGRWAKGEQSEANATGWVQLNATTANHQFVTHGFSGTPVWDIEEDGVVGMVVAVSNESGPQADAADLVKQRDPKRAIDARVAFMIPTGELVKRISWLEQTVQKRPLEGRRCLVLKPQVDLASTGEQQLLLTEIAKAIDASRLEPFEQHADGAEVESIGELVDEVMAAEFVVIDANVYQTKWGNGLCPYLFYYIALRHTKDNRMLLVAKSDTHLPHG